MQDQRVSANQALSGYEGRVGELTESGKLATKENIELLGKIRDGEATIARKDGDLATAAADVDDMEERATFQGRQIRSLHKGKRALTEAKRPKTRDAERAAALDNTVQEMNRRVVALRRELADA